MKRIENITKIRAAYTSAVGPSQIVKSFTVPEFRKIINKGHWIVKMTSGNPAQII